MESLKSAQACSMEFFYYSPISELSLSDYYIAQFFKYYILWLKIDSFSFRWAFAP